MVCWKKKLKSTVPKLSKYTTSSWGKLTLLDIFCLYIESSKISDRHFFLRIFSHYCDLMVLNSWLRYRRDANDLKKKKTMDLWEFKSSIAENLCAAKQPIKIRVSQFSSTEPDIMVKKRRGPTVPVPPKTSRQDEIANWPVFLAKERCKKPGCTGIVMTGCEKCNVRLCFTPKKNCFKDFHVSWSLMMFDSLEKYIFWKRIVLLTFRP